MKVNYDNLAIIADNLGNLYEDGIPISDGLELIKELPLNKNYRNSIDSIINDVLVGGSLSEAFNKEGELYPGIFIGILKVGENSGQLGKTLSKLSSFYSKLSKFKKEILNASIYPMFLLITLLVLGIVMCFFIIPSFYENYQSLGNVPRMAEVMHLIKESYDKNPGIFIMFILCYGAIIPLGVVTIIKYRGKRSNIFIKFKLVREIEEFVFILLLSLILDSGVSIPLGINYCLESDDIKFLYNDLKKINQDIMSGKELSECISNMSIISKYSLAMIKLGENSGSLSERVKKVEDRLEKRTKEEMGKFMALIQPAITIIMAVSVLIFIWIFVLPMFDMLYGGVA